MKTYNKLVRDNIPEIIRATGKTPVTRMLSNAEFPAELNKKLQEEVGEYLEDESLEELADILEVIHGMLKAKGKTFAELEELRMEKEMRRGSFEKQIFLESVED